MFFCIQTSIAQDYSLVSTLHQTRYTNLETNHLQTQSYNDDGLTIQDFELGLYHTKNNTIYFVSYELRYEFSEEIENRPDIFTTYYTLRNPFFYHKVRAGIGSQYNLNRKIHSLIYAFFTYGWGKGQRSESTTTVQSIISQRRLGEKPKSNYIDLGIKAAIEYDLSNHWTFGVELNSYLFLRLIKTKTFAIHEQYDDQGNLTNVLEFETEHKDFDLQTNLFKPALYLKFKF